MSGLKLEWRLQSRPLLVWWWADATCVGCRVVRDDKDTYSWSVTGYEGTSGKAGGPCASLLDAQLAAEDAACDLLVASLAPFADGAPEGRSVTCATVHGRKKVVMWQPESMRGREFEDLEPADARRLALALLSASLEKKP